MKAVLDPRCGRKTKHDHGEVLVCLVAGFLAGKTTVRRSLRWCKKHLEELRGYLPLKNGIASPSTACRLLSGIDEELFALEFMEWIGEIVSTKGVHLAVDGKALRAAMEKVKEFRAPMVLNAVDAVTGVVVAQMPIKKWGRTGTTGQDTPRCRKNMKRLAKRNGTVRDRNTGGTAYAGNAAS